MTAQAHWHSAARRGRQHGNPALPRAFPGMQPAAASRNGYEGKLELRIAHSYWT